MKSRSLALIFILIGSMGLVTCSSGDRMTEYLECRASCYRLMDCQRSKLQSQDDSHSGSFFHISNLRSRGNGYTQEYFVNYDRLYPLTKFLFRWDCHSDCDYKCQQIVTDKRISQGDPMVQFNGKWPFKRVCGVQEIFSVIFSLANLYANYINLSKILYQCRKNKIQRNSYTTMYKQYLYLVLISTVGWTFSIVFHSRDNSWTETMDYLGAAAIVLTNFSSIVIRYYHLFDPSKQKRLLFFRILVSLIFFAHCIRLYINWNYNYNTSFNLIFGLSASILWIFHSLKVNKTFKKDSHIYNSSIQLLPYETKLLSKLDYVFISKTKVIPFIPILLNIWIITGISFELFDFEPIYRLIDAHAIWHLFTIFPPLIWYDWNIWDIEMSKVRSNLSKRT